MSPPRARPFLLHIFRGLGWPLVLGLLATAAIYYAILSGIVRNPMLVRYVGGHPIEYAEVGMFFVGLAALVLRAYQLASQSEFLGRIQLPPLDEQQVDPEQAGSLLESLDESPRRFRSAWLYQRLRAALEHVKRQRSADRLDEELKYLAEEAQNASYESYGLVRIIVWAVPMLGFLGTVMGITLALARLSPESLVNKPTEAMEGLLGGLSVAFDTTALALVLSIVLMFVMFVIQQSDSRLLGEIDQQVHHQLSGRFRLRASAAEPISGPLRHLSQQLQRSLDQLAVQHAQTWRETIESVQQQWREATATAAGELSNGMVRSLEQGLSEHARQLARLHEDSEQRAGRWWDQLRQATSEQHKVLERQQQELARVGEIMLKVVEATGQVTQLEHALNQNLKALAGAKNFEDTVMSLSAAIHLLNSRIARSAPKTQQVQLDSGQGKAA